MNDFIHDSRASGGAALVHCFRGKSRSATAVIQYLMQREDFTLKVCGDSRARV
jgi:atypical dual specificity phosphatase